MMLQTTEELRPYIYGAVRIETGEDGFLSFRRLTSLQEEVLLRRGFSPRELATESNFITSRIPSRLMLTEPLPSVCRRGTE